MVASHHCFYQVKYDIQACLYLKLVKRQWWKITLKLRKNSFPSCLTIVLIEPLLFSRTNLKPQLHKTKYSSSLNGSSVRLVWNFPTGVLASNPPWNYTVAALLKLNKGTFGWKWRREPPHGSILWMGPFTDLSPKQFPWFLHDYQSKTHFAVVFIIFSHSVDGWWQHCDL